MGTKNKHATLVALTVCWCKNTCNVLSGIFKYWSHSKYHTSMSVDFNVKNGPKTLKANKCRFEGIDFGYVPTTRDQISIYLYIISSKLEKMKIKRDILSPSQFLMPPLSDAALGRRQWCQQCWDATETWSPPSFICLRVIGRQMALRQAEVFGWWMKAAPTWVDIYAGRASMLHCLINNGLQRESPRTFFVCLYILAIFKTKCRTLVLEKRRRKLKGSCVCRWSSPCCIRALPPSSYRIWNTCTPCLNKFIMRSGNFSFIIVIITASI